MVRENRDLVIEVICTCCDRATGEAERCIEGSRCREVPFARIAVIGTVVIGRRDVVIG